MILREIFELRGESGEGLTLHNQILFLANRGMSTFTKNKLLGAQGQEKFNKSHSHQPQLAAPSRMPTRASAIFSKYPLSL
jgi:hypothetical protein